MVLLLISLTTIIIATVVLYYLPRRGCNIPPGPPRRFIIGNLHQMKPLWTQSFSEWSRIYGPIISVWLGSQLVVVVSSSDLAKQVLRDKDHQLSNRHRYSKMTQNGNDLIWSDYSPHYVKLRKLSTLEMFSLKSIEMFKLMREVEARSMIRSISRKLIGSGDESRKLVVREYLGLAVLNTVSSLVIGKKFESEEGTEFRSITESEDRMAAKATLTDHIWWLRWISSWFVSDKEFVELMDRRRKWFRRAVSDGHGEEGFLQRLLVLQEKKELREETVVGLVWNMFTAGADTTVITIEWTIAEMIRYPAVQEMLQRELDSVLGTERLMTESDIPKLPYLQCVVKEALRLHPPTPLMLPHKASDTVQIGGYEVPQGTTVYVNVQAIGRDPVNWRTPDEFKPERFLLEDTDVKGQDFRILPFGSGRRVCPAAQLSINMMTLMLGNLLHCFSWKSCTPEEHIDMTESPGLVCYMKTPLQALASCRLPQKLYTLSLAEIDR